MDYFAGLDVSLEVTSICIVDADGTEMKEAKVASEPDDLVAFFEWCGMAMKRIGLEAGAPSQWLYRGMAEASLPVVCIETRHAKASLSAMPNKTDRNDERNRQHHAHRLVPCHACEDADCAGAALPAGGQADAGSQADGYRTGDQRHAAQLRSEDGRSIQARLRGARSGTRRGSRDADAGAQSDADRKARSGCRIHQPAKGGDGLRP